MRTCQPAPRLVATLLIASACSFGAGCSQPTPEELLETTTFELARSHGRFELLRGLRTFAITKGSGADMILLHGDPASTYSWRKVIEPLAEHYRVHALDLPGFGFSDKPLDATYGTGWLAGHVLSYLDAHDIKSAVLVGNSTGGEVATEAALLFAPRVAALVLIAPSGLPLGEDYSMPFAFRLLGLPVIGPLLSRLPTRSITAATLRQAVYDPASVTDTDIDAYYLPLRTEGGLRASIARSAEPVYDRTDLVRRIRTPTLVVVGDSDRLLPPRIARAHHELIEGSRLVELEQTGHVPQEERPQRVVSEITTWLASLRDAP